MEKHLHPVQRLRRTWIAGLAIGFAMLVAGPVQAADFAPYPEVAEGQETAIFAGGCFWCIEADFDTVPGVVSTTSGYTGGDTERPTYYEVGSERTGHIEALLIVYDPEIVEYEDLLVAFWRSVDPTDDGGQFCDRGHSYTTAIFATDTQREAAQASKADAQDELGRPVVTPIRDAAPFYPAELKHQNYHEYSNWRYSLYRRACQRDATVRAVWGDAAFRGLGKD